MTLRQSFAFILFSPTIPEMEIEKKITPDKAPGIKLGQGQRDSKILENLKELIRGIR